MTPGSQPPSDDQLHLEADPLWYQDAVIYQLHVRAFADSDGDGIGDFRGLLDKLDYLHDLGVTALWLLPFYPSPLRDDGYDIADYRTVNPAYGTIRDFQAFLRAAHRRGLRVITELVVNHTSDAHPWFQRARRAPAGSRWRNFYVWNETPDRYRDARIIFQDFEHSNWSWDPVAGSYYWHRFYSHQPDLNYESADVRRLISRTLNYWLGLGVDGLRLDAVPYLFEREGTSCENLPETHAFLKELRRYVDDGFENRMLLAEANQWPEDAVAYFGDGDECHMAFHFPVMPRLFMAIQMEDRFPIIDILEQTPEIPSASQWAVFLRNHDELTLEMVTDEERDYMYRVYAHDRQARINLGIRRRLAPLLGDNRAKIELMNGLLLSLPGTPIIYYGDEIGMGDNIYLGDRDGVRTPMQWSSDRNAGFSRGNPQRLYLPVIIDPEFHYETVNVEAQQHNPQSLLGWMRRLISLRNRSKVFGRGSIVFLTPENHRVLAFVRRHEDERVLVVANLSRHAQYVELDLSEFEGTEPLELFGQTSFPPIGELPYLLTLGPHAFYWFALEAPRVELPSAPLDVTPATVQVAGRWTNTFRGRAKKPLEAAIQQYLERRRWFAGKARRLESISLGDVVPVPVEHAPAAAVAVVEAHYVEGESETYVLPLMIAVEERMEHVLSDLPQAIVALLELRGQPGVLIEAVYDQDFCQALLDAVRRRRRFRGSEGAMAGRPTPVLRQIIAETTGPLVASVSGAEQSNSSVVYGNQLILKVFRRVENGLNPDLEIGRFLTDRTDFSHAPAVTGALEYRVGRGEPTTFAIVHEIVPNEGDAWSYTLDELSRYFERILRDYEGEIPPERPTSSFVDLARAEVPELIRAESEAYLQAAELMGRRTGELHIALASDRTDKAFAPEDFTPLYQRSAYQSMRSLTRRNIQLLRRRLPSLPEVDRPAVERVIRLEPDLLDRFRFILERKLTGQRTRYHGDFHLGQVLYTGNDFFIIDFEGEPARSFADRRVKRSALRDVAGMIRSFDYATRAALRELIGRGVIEDSSEQASWLGTWGRFWYRWVGASYLRAYLDCVEGCPFVPRDQEELRGLLAAFTLEKAVYEIGYELNSRPDWARIPVAGVIELAEQPG